MSKRYWVFSLLAFVVGFFLVYTFQIKTVSKEELKSKVPVLPSIRLTGLDSAQFEIDRKKGTVLVYFNSECDHCQRQLAAIDRELGSFGDTEFVLMSSQSLVEIRTFAKTFSMTGRVNVHFVRIDYTELSNVFGALSVPQIFVYDRDGKLEELFSGETEVQILKEATRR